MSLLLLVAEIIAKKYSKTLEATLKFLVQGEKNVPKRDESNKTLTVALGLDMQFRSSSIRLLIANLNIVTQRCAENL